MAQIINTNLASLNTQRNLNASQAGTNQALQRLSSGLRINSAKDDAAGLAISTRFESQIKGLGVAIRNAGDGVSLAQTGEGALGSMTDNLQRIRELALQAANGTNSAADREALQAEAALLIEEIGRVSEGANFNGVNLLDGSFTTSFQVGANAGETINVSIGKLTADTLGVSTKSGVSSTSSSSAITNGDLVINGVTIGASRASDDTASTDLANASAISKAAAINRASAETGVTALVDSNVAAGAEMTAVVENGSITINGTTINIQTTADAASSRSAVVTAINEQSALTGVKAVDSGDDALGVSLVAADGRNIELSLGTMTSAATGLAASGTHTGGITLVANSGTNSIAISGANVGNAGLTAGNFVAGVSTVSSSGQVALPALADSEGAVTGSADLSAIAFDFSQAAGPGAPAVLTGSAAIDATGTDFTTDDISFTLDVNGTATTVTLDQDYTDLTIGGGAGSGNAAMLAEINLQLTGSGITASLNATDNIVFTEAANNGATVTFADAGGTDDAETIFGLTGAGATATGTAPGASTAATFSVAVDGGAVQNVTVDNNVTNSADLLTEINGQLSGATASLDATSGALVITSNTTGATSSVAISNLGGTAAAQLGLAAATGTGSDAGVPSYNNLEAGDMVINGVNIGAARATDDTASYDAAGSSSKEASGISIAAAINRSAEATGVTATVNATETVGATAATVAANEGNTATLHINGVQVNMIDQGDVDGNRAFAVNQINAVSGQTGVVAEDNGTSVTLKAADGRNIVLAMDSVTGTGATAANFGLGNVGTADFAADGVTANDVAQTTYSSVTLSSAGTINVSGGTNGNDDLAALGFKAGDFGGGVSGQFLTEVDISTQKGAISALAAVDNALNSVNAARADLGAIQNRFEATISNLEVSSENLSAANSRIRDADFAAEAANLARSQVLQQAGISILAQANASGEQVLSLLR